MKKILFLLLATISGFAQTLDPTFDTDGIATLTVSNTPSTQIAYDAALQTDGKIVYVGRLLSPYQSGFIARYNPDGSKDNTFNQYGFKSTVQSLQTVQIQNDGKIVMAGLSMVTRITSNGSADVTFNTTGSKSIAFNNQAMNIKSIRFQTDDKIVVSGYISNGTNNDFAIARLNSDGTLDTTFDTDGILILPIGTDNDRSFSHKIQTDGKIVVFGSTFNGTNNDFAVVRINTNGTLDTTFGVTGKVITAFTSTSSDTCFDGEILSNGKIVAFGSSAGLFAFTRYNSNGTLDTTLDSDGKLTLNHAISISGASTSTSIHALPKIKVLADDKIIVSGTSNQEYKVIKLLANGSSYDTTFDTDGVVSIIDNISYSTFLIIKPDGKLITGGYSYTNAMSDYKIKQLDIDTNGVIVSNNYKNLYLSNDLSPRFSFNTLVLSNQSYLVTVESGFNIVLIKILPNGIRDMNFGTGGLVNLGSNLTSCANIHLLSDGKIIVSNSSNLYKMDINGIMDNSFGNAGVLDLTTFDNKLDFIDDYTISNDNKILIACDYNYNVGGVGINRISTAVVKLNIDGTLDTTFGVNGIVNYDVTTNAAGFHEYPTAIYQDANNKILVSSISIQLGNFYGNQTIYLAKLNSDGSFDTTFGTNGWYNYSTGNTNESIVAREIISSIVDNCYLISNTITANYLLTNTLKINSNGVINTSFGNNGVVTTLPNANYIHMITQADGKILKGGQKDKQFSIIRYNTDGSLDLSFGVNGEVNTPIEYSSGINNVQLQTDGKLIATGDSYDGDREKIAMVRYTDLNLGTIDLSSPKNSLLVYPNPIEKEATFQYTLDNNETVSIDLVDFQGRVIQNIITNKNQSAGLQSVNISLNETIASGNYFLKIASSKGSQSVQIIKK
ncbi:T9SS type A sorting domain-containing protein [Flavobacterium koreense]